MPRERSVKTADKNGGFSCPLFSISAHVDWSDSSVRTKGNSPKRMGTSEEASTNHALNCSRGQIGCCSIVLRTDDLNRSRFRRVSCQRREGQCHKANFKLSSSSVEHRTVTPGGKKISVKFQHVFTSWTTA